MRKTQRCKIGCFLLIFNKKILPIFTDRIHFEQIMIFYSSNIRFKWTVILSLVALLYGQISWAALIKSSPVS
ncbi:hypothetical protein SAMN04487891_102271 [Flagellimonas taeanensis]|uniref:Uncharacterized protein n=1 Tax=Flagellimonas taeanensis TaxID=1005926 RepID=A0A1M6S1B2_9FLAO|nr:hypothetical protein SAMN04487891_102271 [Allomuricauda taeanensis]SHK38463.1 hypothetical protein SAMN05216293_0950 [Allomuricauda taeanensis]